MPSWLSDNALLPVFLVLLGLCLGSFLNVVIHRLPRGESLSRPRSRCPGCGEPIAARDNIPLLSWILLRGRCRHCGEPISPRYPLIELLGAACVLGAALASPGPVTALLRAAFLLAMLAVVFIDIDHQIIPDRITLPGTLLGLLAGPLLGLAWWEALLGAGIGGGLLLAAALFYQTFRGVEGMGGGDIKMAAMLGAWLGWQGLLMTLLLASFAGTLIGIGLILARRADVRTALPFGAFLAPAAGFVLLAGRPIWHWYIALAF